MGKTVSRVIAIKIAAALFAAAPGVEPYRLLAAVLGGPVEVPVKVSAQGIGATGAGVGHAGQGLGGTGMPGGTLANSLDSALPNAGSLAPGLRGKAGAAVAPAASDISVPRLTPETVHQVAPAGIAPLKASPKAARAPPTQRVSRGVAARPPSGTGNDPGTGRSRRRSGAGLEAAPPAVKSVSTLKKNPLIRSIRSGKDVESSLDGLFHGARRTGPVNLAEPASGKTRAASLKATEALAATLEAARFHMKVELTNDWKEPDPAFTGGLTTLEASYLMLQQRTRRNIYEFLDELEREYGGFSNNIKGKYGIVKSVIETFREELKRGRKPSFDVTYADKGVTKALRGPNGETAAELMWEALKERSLFSEETLQRYLYLTRRINETTERYREEVPQPHAVGRRPTEGRSLDHQGVTTERRGIDSAALTPARVEIKASLASRALAGVKSKLSTIKESFSGFNRSEKAFILGQSVFLFALSIYLATLPLLVQALTGNAAMTGVARAMHYWVFAGASLFSGSIVKRSPMKRILVGGALTRALTFGTIGILALMGGLPWVGFLALVGINAMIVSMNHLVDIDTDGARKVFSTDKKIEQAGYIYDFIYYGMMLVVPPLIGIPMDWLDATFGAGIGAAVGFTSFASVMTLAALIYAKHVKIIGENFAVKKVRGILAGLRGTLRAAWEVLSEAPKRNWQTAKLIWNNKKILTRSMMATAENFVEDALFAVVLPSFAIDILKAGATGNGLLLSAVTLGGLLASVFLVRFAQRIQNRIGTYRFLTLLTIGASLAFIPSIGLWAAPSLLWAIPLVAALKFLYQPLRSRMRALLQVEIKNDPAAKGHAQEIFGLMTVIEVIAAGAGGLAFAWLFMHAGAGSAVFSLLGAGAPMKVVTLSLAVMSVVYLVGLRMLRGQIPIWKRYSSGKGALARELEKAKKNLEVLGYTPYKTKKVDEPVSHDRPTVAVLAPASTHKLAMIAEGGRQSPGDVHLALDASWLIQQKLPDGRTRLLLKKGLHFDEKGEPWIAEYAQPREVRYFANFYTMGANERGDGVPFEADADMPMSSSERLEAVTNDKLLTRLMMAAKGIAVPATLAFLLAAHPLTPKAAEPTGADDVSVAAMPESKTEVRKRVETFLAGYDGDEVVVKPSGPAWHSSKGVEFFKTGQVDAIVDHVVALSKDPDMTPDGAVLVDGRLTPPALYFRSTLLEGRPEEAKTDSWGIRVDGNVGLDFLTREEIDSGEIGKSKKDWNLRVLIGRTPWDGGQLMGIFSRAGAWGMPTVAEPGGANAEWDPEDAAVVTTYEDVIAMLRKQYGLLKTEEEAEAFTRELEDMGAQTLAAISENEARRAREAGEPYQAKTDFIGLDVMVQYVAGKLVPMVIEVNDHDSGGQMHLDRFHPDRAGEHSRAWVATMLARARRDALKGKTIVMVGGGYQGKRHIFERAQELGVKVVLIDKPGSWAAELVDEYIPVDTMKPEEAAKKVLAEIEARGIRGDLDGITSFWEDDVPLTAAIAQGLELPYFSQDAAKAARDKSLTRKAMEEAGLPTPRNAVADSMDELEKAMEHVGFPAILKPASGAEAKFVNEVRSKAEARRTFTAMKTGIAEEAKVDGAFSPDVGIVVEQYLDGVEVDVDVVMRDGKAVFASVTDNWPTKRPHFLATGSNLPSRLPPGSRERLKDLAEKTALALGLEEGVFHIEGKMTSQGPRIIEANARLGGVYVHDWVKAVWGVDLVEEALLSAAGIPSVPYRSPRPLAHLEGEFLIPEKSGRLAALDGDGLEGDPSLFELKRMMKIGSDVNVPPYGTDRVGMLTARGEDPWTAAEGLKRLRGSLRLVIRPEGED